MLDPARSFDIIGDVHGCALTLERLLDTLGYQRIAGVWRHPRRQALFLGDIVDRGPRIREALHIVHDMVAAGQAHCIMGNHEYSALGWVTPALPGSGKAFVREHTPRHARLIDETLTQFAHHPADWQAFLDWFQTLPLFIDAGRFRLVHACWDARLIEPLRRQYPDGRVDRHFVQASAVSGSFAANVCNRLLRGTDMRLPDGLTLTGGDGLTRAFFRTKFWEDDPQTYGDIVFQPDALPAEVANTPLSHSQKSALLRYAEDEPMLFVGHYWRSGRPAPIRSNLACLDYSAVLYGKLVAYRLDDETRIDPRKFVWVDVDRPQASQ
ncbi:metallophosphoesterase [Pseudomonas fulva]|uniref:metallophosphoesterase n=1 Tax=Pseudomonas TaxID=286 RepID=UPI000B502EA5|nr:MULTISPECIES: metallophosphoesterase [Pseudomonas]MDP9666087.1 diadenosine tetraphosphatase ApaH/serine/threonine PP2A family protein phosphatase [Pseudomonas cremoricolorata]AVF54920.1 serine/threonine protein phosphatase [Pseudomonas fulva]MCP3791304.1 metallophosphoesterase [Pseudomonas sp. N2-11]MDH0619866.1 metallophosphoesterase [Pseudomonas fulva]MDH1307823.1 metallophosphoesterase [Pseudomonas fulva]